MSTDFSDKKLQKEVTIYLIARLKEAHKKLTDNPFDKSQEDLLREISNDFCANFGFSISKAARNLEISYDSLFIKGILMRLTKLSNISLRYWKLTKNWKNQEICKKQSMTHFKF
jgi:hypothetical protein